MATVTKIEVNKTVAGVLLTPLNKRNTVNPKNNKMIDEKRLLAIAIRNSDSLAKILLAVAAASPNTISLGRTYIRLKAVGTTDNNQSKPASLALLFSEFICSSMIFYLVFMLFCF
jgi:hypothetical protein